MYQKDFCTLEYNKKALNENVFKNMDKSPSIGQIPFSPQSLESGVRTFSYLYLFSFDNWLIILTLSMTLSFFPLCLAIVVDLSLFSAVNLPLFAGGFRVAQFVRIDREPNH